MSTTPQHSTVAPGRRLVWMAGLLVAAGAGLATAHGLYEVAIAARVPASIAWLYPLITDGLALVAYAATSRVTGDTGRHYAAGIVILAAGLSGLAQAVNLAGGIARADAAPVGVRFGVGAWPAVAAALTAHLLHLIFTASTPYSHASVQPSSVNDDASRAVQRSRTPSTAENSSARERARSAARSHYARHGRLPTVSELVLTAHVARGTAGTVLKDLRINKPAVQLINADSKQETDE